MPQQDASELVGSIYDAATGTIDWADLSLALRESFSAGLTNIFLFGGLPTPPVIVGTAGFPEKLQADYISHFHQHDPWAAGGKRIISDPTDPRRSFLGPELIEDPCLRESEFYRDFARYAGAFHSICSAAELGSVGLAMISLFRPEDAPTFVEADRRMMAGLLPHFNRGLRLHQQLEAAGSARMVGQAALDALSVGVAVVDQNLRVAMINAATEHLAASGEGVRLGRLGPGPGAATHLDATHDGERRTLAILVENAVRGGPGGGMRFTRHAQLLPIAALVMPLPARFGYPPPQGSSFVPGMALVLMRDLNARAMPPAAWLGTLFGLTEAEATVAVAAVNGATAEAIAIARKTSPLTVRKQLRSILEKSGTANLRELTRILAIIPEAGPKSNAGFGDDTS